MYPVSLGFGTAKKRIVTLVENGHHAEALLTSVFTFEKIIHRTLKQLIVSSGFRSKDAKTLLSQIQGFKKQNEIWSCFDPKHRGLPEIIGNEHWQHVKKAVQMRNRLVHGKQSYTFQECKIMTVNMVALLEHSVAVFNQMYSYNGWSTVAVRKISKLHCDAKVTEITAE